MVEKKINRIRYSLILIGIIFFVGSLTYAFVIGQSSSGGHLLSSISFDACSIDGSVLQFSNGLWQCILSNFLNDEFWNSFSSGAMVYSNAVGISQTTSNDYELFVNGRGSIAGAITLGVVSVDEIVAECSSEEEGMLQYIELPDGTHSFRICISLYPRSDNYSQYSWMEFPSDSY